MNFKKILRFLSSRLAIISLLIALQVIFLLVVFLSLSKYLSYSYQIMEFLSFCVVVWIVSNQDNPSYKLIWVIAILIAPVFGGAFYLIFGNKKISKKLRTKIRDFYIMTVGLIIPDKAVKKKLAEISPHLATQASYVQNAAGHTVWENTKVDYYNVGEHFFEGLISELEKAKKFIFMEYFIIQQGEMWDNILDILIAKVQEGVEVYVMYDDLGCIKTLPWNYAKQLKKHGIKAHVFNPFQPHLNMAMNYRDHRKICVVDGNVGFCGGINLADEYINVRKRYGHWKDTAVRLKGDAVWSLTTMFLTIWEFSTGEKFSDLDRYKPTEAYSSDGFVQPFSDSPLDSVNIAENIYLHIINRANRYIYITTPYLIIDNEMVTALCTAAQSGVDVRIITPHIADKWYVHIVTQAYYKQLIQAGVKIYEYTPGFVHAKMFVCDDEVAVVGTANMDYRSLYLHFECGILFYCSSMIGQVKKDVQETLKICQRITYEQATNVPLYKRVLRGTLRILAPLM